MSTWCGHRACVCLTAQHLSSRGSAASAFSQLGHEWSINTHGQTKRFLISHPISQNCRSNINWCVAACAWIANILGQIRTGGWVFEFSEWVVGQRGWMPNVAAWVSGWDGGGGVWWPWSWLSSLVVVHAHMPLCVYEVPTVPHPFPQMLHTLGVPLRGAHAVIIGASNLFGLPMGLLLLKEVRSPPPYRKPPPQPAHTCMREKEEKTMGHYPIVIPPQSFNFSFFLIFLFFSKI